LPRAPARHISRSIMMEANMLRLCTGAALLAALAGCGGGGGEEQATRSVQPTSPYVEKLKGLSEMNRGLALRRAILDTGGTCKRVDVSGFQEDYKNMSMWTARCSDGNDWAVFIAPNGDVQVRGCADLATLGLPACRLVSRTS
jgi:hypothetical protein